jgi:ankyrin repeat protein
MAGVIALVADPRVDVNTVMPTDFTPLRLAIKYNHRVAFDALMTRTDLNHLYTSTRAGWTYLHIAHRNPYMLMALLQRGAIDVNVGDWKGMTVLHRAASVSDAEVAEILLSQPGINVNARDYAGMSPLHRALRDRNTRFAEKLIEFARTDINMRSGKGASPIDLAITRGLLECARALCRRTDLDVSAGAGKRNSTIWSPLALATFHRRIEMIEMLLEYPGMNIKRRKHGLSHAIRIAKANAFNDCIQVLKAGRRRIQAEKEGFFAKLQRRKSASPP